MTSHSDGLHKIGGQTCMVVKGQQAGEIIGHMRSFLLQPHNTTNTCRPLREARITLYILRITIQVFGADLKQ